jgi:beta-galactosidase
MRYLLFVMILASFTVKAQVSDNTDVRISENFNQGWKFHIGDITDAYQLTCNDTEWRTLVLPHDWSVEGAFSESNPATPGGGALPGGIGWYRKTFRLPSSYKGKCVFVNFDGVYRKSEVWINGHYLGMRPNGYISFQYELTSYLNFDGKDNVLVVKVDNSQQPNSRWYSGSGIYRNVKLVVTNPVFVDLWGTFVSTPKVSEKEATVAIETNIRNTTKKVVDVEVIHKVIDMSGKELRHISAIVHVNPESVVTTSEQIQMAAPKLWSIEQPYLYRIVTKLITNGVLTDQYETPFGIRFFQFDVSKGFMLNGKSVKILGVCNHHDLGCLGAAFNVRAAERQLQILKDMGCNGIRTSHNPPAPELLDLCDRMGFIVMDEAFDMWRKKKSPYDYAQYFDEWHEKDLTDQILRDRNHPSVFIWCVGNEVLEQWNQADADTLNLKETNLLLNFTRKIDTLALKKGEMSVNSLVAIKLADIVKKLDPTRPITTANNEPGLQNNIFRSGAMDIIGYNYHEKDAMTVPQRFPGKPFIFTETTSGLMTRGYYRMPSDSMYIWPKNWDIPFSDPSFSCSSYDNCHVPWGTTHEETWKIIKKNDFISGLYIWTGFDYLGEPTPYWWPARSSFFGIVDLAGFPKDVYYMYQSEWTQKPVLHIFPHWNWKQGDSVDVWAYTNAQEVELFLNGKSLGVRQRGPDDLHLKWRVAYVPGTLKAIGRSNKKDILTSEVKTAGEPAAIVLSADRENIQANGTDLSFITVKVVDKEGNVVPVADNLVKFEIKGNATIAGVDNGSPISSEPFKANYRKAFYGKCLVVVQSGEKSGEVMLTATSEGLKSAVQRILLK